MRETPTPSRRNRSAQAAASGKPPMQVSAITHSTGRPQACRSVPSMSAAAARAIAIVKPSSDSRTPP